MRRTLFLAAALCATSQAAHSGIMTKSVPMRVVSVTNTTATTVRCRVQVDGKAPEVIDLVPGYEWVRRTYSETSTSSINCDSPVRQVQFSLLPGRRYVLLRIDSKAGPMIDLKEATLQMRR